MRRLLSLKNSSASKLNTDQREKAHLELQFKILDIGRPLLYLGSCLTDPDSKEALDGSATVVFGLQRYYEVKTAKHQTAFGSQDGVSLENQDNFEVSESNHLLGRYFLRAMVRSTDDEAKLNAVSRSGGSSTSRHRRDSRGGWHDHRKDRHPYRNQYNKSYGNKNQGFSQQFNG